ncbi:UvrD/REP helicase N-terminal domain-containing protein [Saccharopolyspora shandongensis]|uniref:DNA 3'-5' helicase n=1 Tax=Saccharopolyspora shandongensis TaxID=418495 RepID=A0A1H2S1I7_9PSEU|nr:3'-5' exonuclease [Saccharopolyspora shandongensis]SDW25481.1 UvrD/REP helicase N-terminal domain-containing protein [Saccharopolyspora shandongensis]
MSANASVSLVRRPGRRGGEIAGIRVAEDPCEPVPDIRDQVWQCYRLGRFHERMPLGQFHVVVDEAQDLNPAHWRLLRGVVPVGPDDLFICEDAHQRIYGDRVALSRYRDKFARALREADIPAVVVEDGDASTRRDAIHVATMYRAKGVEYQRVAVVGADAGTVPLNFVLDQSAPEEQDDVRQRERCLFYVACTRPRDQLVVTWTGTPTPFLSFLSGAPATE